MDPNKDSNINDNLQSESGFEHNEYEQDTYENLDEEQGSASDTDSEPQHEETGEGGESQQKFNQDAINAAIDRQHAKYREEQRRAQALEQENARLRQLAAQNDPEPKIPDIDPYATAEELQEQVKERDEALRAHMAWQQRQRESQAQYQQYEQQSYQSTQQQAVENTQKFFERAADAKIDQQQLTQAIQTVGAYQLGQEVAKYLLSDDMGAQMTTALARDRMLLNELSFMQPHERILHIERNVRSKLKKPTPRNTQSKKPPTRVQGRSADISDKYPLTGGKVRIR